MDAPAHYDEQTRKLMQQAEEARLTGFDLLAHMGQLVDEQIQQAAEDLTRVQAALENLDGDTTRIIKINAGDLEEKAFTR